VYTVIPGLSTKNIKKIVLTVQIHRAPFLLTDGYARGIVFLVTAATLTNISRTGNNHRAFIESLACPVPRFNLAGGFSKGFFYLEKNK